jgi:hypothetical protein
VGERFGGGGSPACFSELVLRAGAVQGGKEGGRVRLVVDATLLAAVLGPVGGRGALLGYSHGGRQASTGTGQRTTCVRVVWRSAAGLASRTVRRGRSLPASNQQHESGQPELALPEA